MCLDCSSRVWGTLVVKPLWVKPMKKQFGKPWLCRSLALQAFATLGGNPAPG